MSVTFGTDGLRGIAGKDLDERVALALGRAAAHRLDASDFILGADTRVSSPPLAAAFAAGVSAEGCTVHHVGIAPTPGIAFLCDQHGWPGAVVTASHNTYEHNGIKLFSTSGRKLSEDIEADIELLLTAGLNLGPGQPPTSSDSEALTLHEPELLLDYERHLISTVEDVSLSGLRVALDCANGAVSSMAARVFDGLGVETTVINATPDGFNINRACGSTAMDQLIELVQAGTFDVGFAFDGDADRVLAVDGEGNIVDGDFLLAILAKDLKARGHLPDDAIVVSMWSNLGLHAAMLQAGIRVVVTEVGDKYILQELDTAGYGLGGEQSGHIIFRDLATTGDGLLTAIQTLCAIARAEDALTNLARRAMTRMPQAMENVPVDRSPLEVVRELEHELAAENASLDGAGRLVLRPSGTESVVRVMAEARDHADALDLVRRYAARVEVAGAKPS